LHPFQSACDLFFGQRSVPSNAMAGQEEGLRILCCRTLNIYTHQPLLVPAQLFRTPIMFVARLLLFSAKTERP
jgi:hypothetical protein